MEGLEGGEAARQTRKNEDGVGKNTCQTKRTKDVRAGEQTETRTKIQKISI